MILYCSAGHAEAFARQHLHSLILTSAFYD